MQRITPFLTLNDKTEEAMDFYVSTFKNSKVLKVARYTAAGPLPEGTIMMANFMLDGQEFVALNGGPNAPFTQAISFVIECADQKEVDHYWEQLTAGGKALQCGWLEDKFGVSWQVTPRILLELVNGPDRAKAARVMQAMFKMTKIVIRDLEKAAAAQ